MDVHDGDQDGTETFKTETTGTSLGVKYFTFFQCPPTILSETPALA